MEEKSKTVAERFQANAVLGGVSHAVTKGLNVCERFS